MNAVPNTSMARLPQAKLRMPEQLEVERRGGGAPLVGDEDQQRDEPGAEDADSVRVLTHPPSSDCTTP